MILPSPINPKGETTNSGENIGKARMEIVDKTEWLERLLQNPDFTRFLAFVKQGAESTRAQAEDIQNNEAAKRDAFAQRHFGLVAIYEWPEKSLLACRGSIEKLNEKQRQLQSGNA